MEMLQSCGLLSNEKTKLKKREKEERERFVIKCDINNPLLTRRDCVPHSATRQGCSANLPTEASAKNYAQRPYKVHVCHSSYCVSRLPRVQPIFNLPVT